MYIKYGTHLGILSSLCHIVQQCFVIYRLVYHALYSHYQKIFS